VFRKFHVILWCNTKKVTIMALEIKSPPVLEGKAAREFYKRAAEAKCSKSKEEVQALVRKWSTFWAEQERLHPSSPW
jgi:hypothetical protein